MGENDQRKNDEKDTSNRANNTSRNDNKAAAPQKENVAEGAHHYGNEFWREIASRPFREMVALLDRHDGLVTALATVAIAYLTYSLAADSSRQAEISQGQLAIVKDQLQEMKNTRISYDATMASQMAIMRDQAKAMQGQLEEALASQRPWITIVPTIDNLNMSQFKNMKTITLAVDFTMHNNGHEPAQNIQIDMVALPFSGNPRSINIKSMFERSCDEARRISDAVKDKAIGPAVLAGENGNDSRGGWVDGSRLSPGIGLLLVYGCVDYSYPPDRHGQALFSYVLGRQNEGRQDRISFQENETEITLRPPNVSLQKYHYGNEIR